MPLLVDDIILKLMRDRGGVGAFASAEQDLFKQIVELSELEGKALAPGRTVPRRPKLTDQFV